jgi:hypothetical protein
MDGDCLGGMEEALDMGIKLVQPLRSEFQGFKDPVAPMDQVVIHGNKQIPGILPDHTNAVVIESPDLINSRPGGCQKGLKIALV